MTYNDKGQEPEILRESLYVSFVIFIGQLSIEVTNFKVNLWVKIEIQK